MREVYITINGVAMTEKEFKKYRQEKLNSSQKKKTTKKRKPKKEVKEISILAFEIEKLTKKLPVLKSLAAYYDNSHRQWGTIMNEILKPRNISKPFVCFRVKMRELESLINDINMMSKHNEKAAYQYVEKIAWKLEDIKADITELQDGVNKNNVEVKGMENVMDENGKMSMKIVQGVIYKYANHECMNGKGRRLGLMTLMNRSFKALVELDIIVRQMKKIADEGVDVMNVGDHMTYRTRSRCWA